MAGVWVRGLGFRVEAPGVYQNQVGSSYGNSAKGTRILVGILLAIVQAPLVECRRPKNPSMTTVR